MRLQGLILYFQLALGIVAEGMVRVHRFMDEVYEERAMANLLEGCCCTQPEDIPVLADPLQVLFSLGRGVRFQMVINQHSPATEEFRGLIDPIAGAEVVELSGNSISMQGLSDREVVIAFPGMESYTAVLIRSQDFVGIISDWFHGRIYRA